MEMDQNPVRFVHKHGNVVAVSQIDDFLQVGAHPEVRRIDDQHGFDVRVTL
ncbi:Uncharacterised protein [Actinobacillus pleuropneumoniae]|nr:Uncharacterised protein [Actinobacillus pleuropneumoniae]